MNSAYTRKTPAGRSRWAIALVLFALVLTPRSSIPQEQQLLRLPPTEADSRSAEPGNPSVDSGGLDLPRVPLREPRPAEGDVPELQWQTDVPPGTPPTAGFIDPLRGNDAVIEMVLGQARLLNLRSDLVDDEGTGVIAVADPTVVHFDVMPNRRQIRLIALRPGVTDLSIIKDDDEIYNFEVQVVYDLKLLEAQLRHLFPDAGVRLFQLREYLAVEGQVRSIRQADQILNMLEMYLGSLPVAAAGPSNGEEEESSDDEDEESSNGDDDRPSGTYMRQEMTVSTSYSYSQDGDREKAAPILNLLRVPGVHQVMLQVQIAELNRTALRGIGADLYYRDRSGRTLGTDVSGAGSQNLFAEQSVVTDPAGNTTTVTGPEQLIGLLPGAAASGFALFPSTTLDVTLRALRTNGVMSVLAEPNLVAMSGEKAHFLAGGEIPIPTSTVTGAAAEVSIDWRQFGVQLEFQPFVLEDETIRLIVRPEESSLDYANAIQVAGSLVPAISTRQVETTVEMRQGQTLAMAGLLRVSITGNTKRIPGLGDLPYIGPLFSNTTHQRVEKELMILVTPYLVAPMNPEEVPCLPTDGIIDPNDLEFYLLNRIEGRTGREFYSTREWDDPWRLRYLMHLEQSGRYGPAGFAPMD